MQLLPPEIFFQILSHIPYYDLLELRLVNKWFDEQVTRQTHAISFVRFISQQNQTSHLDPLTYQFNFNKLELHVNNKTQLSHVLAMVETKFPAVQAIDVYDIYKTIDLSLLMPFAHKLKYLRAYKVNVDVPFESAQDIMDIFPALQAFDVGTYSEPFCVNMWARRSNFSQWSNVCDHQPPCEDTDHLPTATIKCIKLANLVPREIDLKAIASSLQVLVLKEVDAPQPILYLPKLKFFRLESYKNEFDYETFFNFLANAPKVRSISIHAGRTKISTSLSFLCFVNSLAHIESIYISINHIMKRGDKVKPVVFDRCEKRKLSQIDIYINKCGSGHFTLIKSLLDSCEFLSKLRIITYRDVEVHVSMNYFEKETLCISTVGPANLKQLLEILAHRYHRLITHLYLSTKKGVDASFVDFILKFKNLQKLSGKLTEGCIKRWLPLFTQSDNRKYLQLDLHQYDLHVLTVETHDLLLESKSNGTLKKFIARWLCPMRTSCSCGLRREFYTTA